LKIHEFQAKQIFAAYSIPIAPGRAVSTKAEALVAAREIGLPVVVKAQVLVGGRGKAGGVKIARTEEEVETHAANILGMSIKGLPVTKILVTRAIDYDAELYLGLIVDRRSQRPVLMASAAGGVEIEEVARTSPEKIIKTEIDPLVGLQAFQARAVGLKLAGAEAQKLKSSKAQENESSKAQKLKGSKALDLPLPSFAGIAQRLYRILIDKDCSLVEINPLVVSPRFASADYADDADSKKRESAQSATSADGKKEMTAGALLALDAKINLDDNALYRHPELAALRDKASEDPGEATARDAGLSYVRLAGSIGCVVNGAGLAMATMDLIKRYGGDPANFLDIGGSSSPEKMATAMKLLLADKHVRAVLVNIFGGITRCDDVAKGLLIASKEIGMNLPVVARLIGTNQAQAREVLRGSPILFADDMSEAVRKVIAVEKGARPV
jgi:succinyl-CoA synthetase beta subunit